MKTDLLPKSIDNAMQNITDKPTSAMGQTFADIWFLVFGAISLKADEKRLSYNYKLKQFENELQSSIDDIPEEKLVEPSIQVTGQALDASKYCITSDILRKMFVNLVSGTMNSDYEKDVHPSFPEILKQLDDKDAKFLYCIKDMEALPLADIGVTSKDGGYTITQRYTVLPYGDLSSDECTISASVLERAGIVTLSTGNEFLTDEKYYSRFKNLPVYKHASIIANNRGTSVHLGKGTCRLTSLGKEFIKVCVR